MAVRAMGRGEDSLEGGTRVARSPPEGRWVGAAPRPIEQCRPDEVGRGRGRGEGEEGATRGRDGKAAACTRHKVAAAGRPEAGRGVMAQEGTQTHGGEGGRSGPAPPSPSPFIGGGGGGPQGGLLNWTGRDGGEGGAGGRSRRHVGVR